MMGRSATTLPQPQQEQFSADESGAPRGHSSAAHQTCATDASSATEEEHHAISAGRQTTRRRHLSLCSALRRKKLHEICSRHLQLRIGISSCRLRTCGSSLQADQMQQ